MGQKINPEVLADMKETYGISYSIPRLHPSKGDDKPAFDVFNRKNKENRPGKQLPGPV